MGSALFLQLSRALSSGDVQLQAEIFAGLPEGLSHRASSPLVSEKEEETKVRGQALPFIWESSGGRQCLRARQTFG